MSDTDVSYMPQDYRICSVVLLDSAITNFSRMLLATDGADMDRIDTKIAAELEEDGRLSFAELGDRVGLSKSPCWTRVRDLQKNGVIRGFEARLDPEALGLGVHCHISVTIRFDAHSEFEAAVIDHPAIVECHTTAGDSDYLLRVYARSVEHLDDLLRHDISKLPGVSGSSTTICLKTIKHKASLAHWAERASLI